MNVQLKNYINKIEITKKMINSERDKTEEIVIK